VFQNIMQTLQSNFVFKGIRTAVLTQVVQRMHCEHFSKGQTIVQQGDQAGPNDRLYYVEVCPHIDVFLRPAQRMLQAPLV
jgi:CRP-like cAMP-binding protein